jgi:hypothetical protein
MMTVVIAVVDVWLSAAKVQRDAMKDCVRMLVDSSLLAVEEILWHKYYDLC